MQFEQVESVEDPVTGAIMSRDAFQVTYGRLVEMLDGSGWDMKPSFWFEAHPLNPYRWVFRDDQRRSEWIDWAIDEVCIPPLKEMQEGESSTDREKRFQKEADDKRARLIQTGKQKKPTIDKRASIQANCTALDLKIERVRAEGGDVSGLERKRVTAYLLLNKWMDVTM